MKHLTTQLAAYNIFIYGVTPNVGPQRGDDISEWLANNPVDNYVILDDDSDMTIHMDYLVKTDFETGLQYTHVDKAIEVLNGK